MLTTRRKMLSKTRATRKMIAIAIIFSLMFAMVPSNSVVLAEEEKTDGENFVTKAYPNHWGRSDLRAYLNGLTKSNDTLPLNSGTTQPSSGYPTHFATDEYDLVQPFTYCTNKLSDSVEATSVYETTDKFWLPSGYFGLSYPLASGDADISASAEYNSASGSALERLIPRTYFSHGVCFIAWARSPYYDADDRALAAYRGAAVDAITVCTNEYSVAAAFKIPLSCVIFSSAASAAHLADSTGVGESDISIQSSEVFYRDDDQSDLPEYGMFLKMKDASATFTPTGLEYDSVGKKLTVNFSGGVAGRYIVVQAFKKAEDDTTEGHVCDPTSKAPGWAAAATVPPNGNTVTVPWTAGSPDGYTFKVWMEYTPKAEKNGEVYRLEYATNPYTFYGKGGDIAGSGTAVSSARLFAMKDELHTSWGTLSSATDTKGTDPTNQKIYFGEYEKTDTTTGGSEIRPMEFWIAGRECDKCGCTDPNGEVMTLCQAVNGDMHQFNAVYDTNYYGKPEVEIGLSDTSFKAPCDETGVEYNGKITATCNGSDLSRAASFQYRPRGTNAWSTDPPTTAGIFDVRAYLKGGENYEPTYSQVRTMTLTGSATAGQFHVSGPTEFVYDGNAHGLKFCGISGTGPVTPCYRRSGSDEDLVPTEPTDVGSYDVQIKVEDTDVVDGTNEDFLKNAVWTMKIGYEQDPPSVTPTDETVKGVRDGTISGVTKEMQYRLLSDSDYTDIDDNTTGTLTGLAPGTYYVRYAATDEKLASADTVVTIAEGDPVSIAVPDSQTGYTLTADPNKDIGWGDKVTLTFELKSGFYRTEDSAITLKDAAGNEFNVETAAVDETKLGEMSVTGSDGVYTLTNIGSNLTVEVSGVEEDNIGPVVNILVGESTVTCDNFDDDITFKNFYTAKQSVTIASTDFPGTGVAAGSTYYYVHQVVDGGSVGLTTDELASVTWTPYSGAFNIEPNSTVIIYAKATDEAGNVSYARTGGLILYTEISSNDDSYKNQDTMTDEGVSLESNTVVSVTSGGVALKKDGDYIIENGTLKLTASYIATLAVGSHSIEIVYTPLTISQSSKTLTVTIGFEVESRINPDDYTDMNQDDVKEGIDLKGGTVVEVKVNGKVLTKGVDYIVADGKVKLTDAFIKTLVTGTYTLEISYRPSTTDPNVEAPIQTVTLTFKVESDETESGKTESGEAKSSGTESDKAEPDAADTTAEAMADTVADSEQATAIGSQGVTGDDEDGGTGTGGQGGTGGDSDKAESQVEEDSIYSSAPEIEYPADEEESAGAESVKGNQFITGACVFGLVALSMMMPVIVLWKRRKKEEKDS